MIHYLTLKNTFKHHGRTFELKEGLNVLKGENEVGKSLVFEFIDFALHGSVALRLPVGLYPANLSVVLVTTIGNVRYRIERSPKKATLFNDSTNEILASGSTGVTAEVRKLLGYNRNVFLTANYSSQDSIAHLSKMTPAERKRTIDNVIGLSAVLS